MCSLEEVTEDIRDIFGRYKEKQQLDLLKTVNKIRCCNCGHKSRIQGVHIQASGFKRMTCLYQITLGLLSFLLILGAYIIWLARYYNESNSLGGGGCSCSFLWPFDNCPVAF